MCYSVSGYRLFFLLLQNFTDDASSQFNELYTKVSEIEICLCFLLSSHNQEGLAPLLECWSHDLAAWFLISGAYRKESIISEALVPSSVFIDKVEDVTCKYNLAKLLSALAKEVKLKLASTFGTS